MKKYIIESFLIVLSVLFSLYIDSLISDKNKLDQKRGILLELNETIDDDLVQLKTVISLQNQTLESIGKLIDDYYKIQKLDPHELANHYSIIKQFGPISFFIQSSPYQQLIQTGTLELIKNKDLIKNLLIAYDSYNKRKEFGDRTLDDFGKDFSKDLAKFILVVESESNDEMIYKKRKVDRFSIYPTYYQSELVIYYYSEYRIWIQGFIHIHENYLDLLTKIQTLIDSEISS